MNLQDLKNLSLDFQPVGSRVTCSPAPTNTDADYLMLVRRGKQVDVESKLFTADYEVGGSTILPNGESVPTHFHSVPTHFHSFTRKGDDINIILTEDPEFFRRFMAATSVAKRLNLLNKEDRIDLFQAVLYGNYRS